MDHIEPRQMKTDLKGLIRLLAQNLYREDNVFIRELIQNGHDALDRRHAEHPNRQITITPIRRSKPGQSVMIFEDNGSGLTETEFDEYISTIGKSGTQDYRQRLLSEGRYTEAQSVIGRFGIGLLSTFVVASKVVIQSRSYLPDSPGWQWECEGDQNYILVPDETAPVGAKITLYIDDRHLHVLDPQYISDAVKKYADFLDVSIILTGEGQLNVVDAPWHKTYASDAEREIEYTLFVQRRFPDVPLAVIPIHLTTPYPVEGVLYISDRRRLDLAALGRIDVYQARMFITADSPDILPPWARFVRGVIDSPALLPNAARDGIVRNQACTDITAALGEQILRYLEVMAETDPLRFERIMNYHHYHIKGIAVEDAGFFRRVAELLPFETNQGMMSLERYLALVERATGKTQILYFSERGQATQFFMLADARNLVVINGSYVFEKEFLEKYAKDKRLPIERIGFGGTNLIFEALKPEDRAAYYALEREFSLIMPTSGSHAEVVRFQPSDMAAVITMTEAFETWKRAEDASHNPTLPESVRTLMRQMATERRTVPVNLYLNANNPTIQRLAQMKLRDEVAANAITAIYNNALMLSQHLITPENAAHMFKQFNRVVSLLIETSAEVDRLRGSPANAESPLTRLNDQAGSLLTQHVTCYVLFDPNVQDSLFQALTEVLQGPPYYWELVHDEKAIHQPDLRATITDKARNAHCFIIDLSENNPATLIQFGALLTLNRPYLVMTDSAETQDDSAPLSNGWISADYDSRFDPQTLQQTLRDAIGRHAGFVQISQNATRRFLSPVILRTAWLTETSAQVIAAHYRTVEEFLETAPEAIARKTGQPLGIIADLQNYIRGSLI